MRLHRPKSPLGLISAAFLAVLAVGAGLQPAWADDVTARTRGSSAQTIIGAPYATACAAAAGQGLQDDKSLEACNLAVTTERLRKENRLATLMNRGAILMRRKDWAGALADFDEALKADKRNSVAHLNRGTALVEAGRAAEAMDSFNEAIRLNVKDIHLAYFNRGNAREILGYFRGAYEDYNTALSIKPEWAPAEQELARFARGRRDLLAKRLEKETAQQ
jgi:tetratricopeptide (TPR) repeat protein